jgi:hypothetical protein
MIRHLRIWLWRIVSELEQRLYPYEEEDVGDYYYTIKNDETGESYMIIEWIKSFDERIIRLQDEMILVQSQLRSMGNDQKVY